MSAIKIVEGEIHSDERGAISSLNNFDFEGIQRTYILRHPDTSVYRGWHAHQFEKKWYYCMQGSFKLWLVAPDNWDNPSKDLPVEEFHVNSEHSEIICVPAGYASIIKAEEPGSIMQVYSDKRFPECLSDSWRYEKDYFQNAKF